MPHDDNEVWIDALAGRIKNPPSDMASEIDVIRNYYLRTGELAEAVDASAQESRHVRMRQWLQERGAFAQPAPVASLEELQAVPEKITRRFAANRGWYAVAAAVLVAVVMVPVVRDLPGQAEPDAPAMRGSSQVQASVVADPEATAMQVLRALAEFGVSVRRVDEEGGGIRVETRLPSRDIPAARALMARYQITVPDNGIVIVRFRPQQ